MYTTGAVIQNYDPSTDTVSLLLTEAGVVDQAIDLIAISAAVDRALLAPGAAATVSLQDAHKICGAVVTGVTGSPGTVTDGSGAVEISYYGRGGIRCDNTGFGSEVVNYSSPGVGFSGPPTRILLYPDGGLAFGLTPTAITNLSMTVVNTVIGPMLGMIWYTWEVFGPR